MILPLIAPWMGLKKGERQLTRKNNENINKRGKRYLEFLFILFIFLSIFFRNQFIKYEGTG